MITRNSRTIARTVDVSSPYAFEINLPGWYGEGICNQTDPESFYPSVGTGLVNHIKTAKRVCGSCPVQTKCLQYAIDNDERFGIWGGLTAHERRKLVDAA